MATLIVFAYGKGEFANSAKPHWPVASAMGLKAILHGDRHAMLLRQAWDSREWSVPLSDLTIPF